MKQSSAKQASRRTETTETRSAALLGGRRGPSVFQHESIVRIQRNPRWTHGASVYIGTRRRIGTGGCVPACSRLAAVKSNSQIITTENVVVVDPDDINGRVRRVWRLLIGVAPTLVKAMRDFRKEGAKELLKGRNYRESVVFLGFTDVATKRNGVLSTRKGRNTTPAPFGSSYSQKLYGVPSKSTPRATSPLTTVAANAT